MKSINIIIALISAQFL